MVKRKPQTQIHHEHALLPLNYRSWEGSRERYWRGEKPLPNKKKNPKPKPQRLSSSHLTVQAFPLPLELQAVISKTAPTQSYSKPDLIQASSSGMIQACGCSTPLPWSCKKSLNLKLNVFWLAQDAHVSSASLYTKMDNQLKNGHREKKPEGV